MKQIIIAFLIIISVNSFGQDSNKPKPIVPPPDSVAFVSQRDMEAFLKWLPESITHSEYLKLKPEDVISLFYRWAIAEWDKKKKKN
jgi:hypothetical protein